MPSEDLYLLSYFLPGPFEIVMIAAIAFLLYFQGLYGVGRSSQERLRRDRHFRNQWFLHATEAEERASRTARQALIIFGVIILFVVAVGIMLRLLN